MNVTLSKFGKPVLAPKARWESDDGNKPELAVYGEFGVRMAVMIMDNGFVLMSDNRIDM